MALQTEAIFARSPGQIDEEVSLLVHEDEKETMTEMSGLSEEEKPEIMTNTTRVKMITRLALPVMLESISYLLWQFLQLHFLDIMQMLHHLLL